MDEPQSLVVERVKLNSDVFHSGQQLEGQVSIACRRKIKLESLILKIVGVARHTWHLKAVNSRDDLRVVTGRKLLRNSYTGESPLWAYQTYLLLHAEVELGAVRCFDFATTIPADCPTSFEGEHGSIRYELSLVAEKDEIIELLYRDRLRVLKPLNVLQFPALLLPLTIEKTSHFTQFLRMPLASGRQSPLHLAVTLPRNAFVAGEVLPIRIVIEKPAGLQLLPLEVSLNRFTSHTSHEFLFELYDVTMAQRTALVYRLIETDAKCPWTRREFEEPLRIPSDEGTTTHITDCFFLQVHYELNVRVVGAQDSRRALALRLPFVLGSHATSTRSQPTRFTVGGSYQSHGCCALYNRSD